MKLRSRRGQLHSQRAQQLGVGCSISHVAAYRLQETADQPGAGVAPIRTGLTLGKVGWRHSPGDSGREPTGPLTAGHLGRRDNLE